MTGDLLINNKDAYTTWGIVFDSSSISALMTPSPMKDYIENESRAEHGKRVIIEFPKVDARTVTLTFSLHANTEKDFYSRYDSFCTELEGGILNIVIQNRPEIIYKCVYKSCKQFTQYNNRLAKFSLIIEESNPKDRNI